MDSWTPCISSKDFLFIFQCIFSPQILFWHKNVGVLVKLYAFFYFSMHCVLLQEVKDSYEKKLKENELSKRFGHKMEILLKIERFFFHFFAKKFQYFIDGKIHKKYWNFFAKVQQSLPG